MRGKKACLIINPRAGQNLAHINGVLAVLWAAGWHTDIAIKEYGGHAMKLAKRAAKKGYDLVIAYGGDGTLNQVVNGITNAQEHRSIAGMIPGGTANVWATEIGIPHDPIKAALALVSSEARMVDIGHIEVESLPGATGDNRQDIRKVKPSSKARHHFLLMAGLGFDAAVMGHLSKPLKYRFGPIAVGLLAAKELPRQHPFPIEIRGTSQDGELLWKGEAIQVVVSNTRRYASIVEMTPEAYIDDGILDICVITSGDPLTTMQQIASLLLRHKPANLTAEYFHDSHLSITVPASIDLQLDGSTVKLTDYLSKADREALQRTEHAEQVMVTYCFEAMPRALQVAIPSTYNDALFEHHHDRAYPTSAEQVEAGAQHISQEYNQQSEARYEAAAGHIDAFVGHRRKVSVIGAAQNRDAKQMYIIAGTTEKRSTGEARTVAVRIDDNTTIIKHTGEHVPPTAVLSLQEGEEIVVEGKQNKRGVIRATRVVI